jgi:hypothetical protein
VSTPGLLTSSAVSLTWIRRGPIRSSSIAGRSLGHPRYLVGGGGSLTKRLVEFANSPQGVCARGPLPGKG